MTYTIEPEQRQEIRRQIGRNLWSISGGRVNPIANGIELPVSNGYTVRVQLTPVDEYAVTRVFRRAGKEWVHGLLRRGFRGRLFRVLLPQLRRKPVADESLLEPQPNPRENWKTRHESS